MQSTHAESAVSARHRHRTLTAICGLALVGGGGSCRDATAPEEREPGITVISGSGASDTVQAALREPLVVHVRDEQGFLAAGVVVRFQSALTTSTLPGWGNMLVPTVYLHPSSGAAPGHVVFDTTDGAGRASVQVSFGMAAGEHAVTVNAPALGMDARAAYAILPGAATGVEVSPADSAVYVGNGYVLRGNTVDRFGNARRDVVTFSGGSSSVRLGVGGTITGLSIGRGFVVAAFRELRDTAWVSVVPRGEILGARLSRDNALVVHFGLDGSEYWRQPVHHQAAPHPDWAADGLSFVMEADAPGVFENNHLVVADAQGTRRRLVDPSLGLVRELYPQYSADGSWIYFSGFPPNVQGNAETWRVRPDGTGAARIGTPAGYYDGESHPSPSPDGSRVAFTTDRGSCCGELTLRLLDVATGAITPLLGPDALPIHGTVPRWAPVADTIGYMREAPGSNSMAALEIRVTSVDGSGQRTVSQPGRVYHPGFDWSPDGRWIIARSFQEKRLHLIEVATGRTLPLGYTAAISHPAWRP